VPKIRKPRVLQGGLSTLGNLKRQIELSMTPASRIIQQQQQTKASPTILGVG